MFLIIVDYKKPLEEVERYLAELGLFSTVISFRANCFAPGRRIPVRAV